jgi:hypothetical protein
MVEGFSVGGALAMTGTPAAPTPSEGADGIVGATVRQVRKFIEYTPVLPCDPLAVRQHDGSETEPLAPPCQTEIVNELQQLTLDLVRCARRQVKQESATSLAGTIALWASLTISVALEIGLIIWLGWEIIHSSSHPNMFPAIVSTVANGACSGTVAYLARRFGRGKANQPTANLSPSAVLAALRNLDSWPCNRGRGPRPHHHRPR